MQCPDLYLQETQQSVPGIAHSIGLFSFSFFFPKEDKNLDYNTVSMVLVGSNLAPSTLLLRLVEVAFLVV